MPPEYHPSRAYPVLFAMHLGREKPEEMLQRIRGMAARHGYIAVAPEWEMPLEDFYHYTPEEQASVVEVLRNLRRRFQVDSDRVFIMGFGQGGNCAYNIALSHPDLFAGAVLISAMPQKFAGRYWHNCQYLPFYLVDGEYSGDTPKKNKPMLEKWIRAVIRRCTSNTRVGAWSGSNTSCRSYSTGWITNAIKRSGLRPFLTWANGATAVRLGMSSRQCGGPTIGFTG